MVRSMAERFYRRVIRIRGDDSPNVRLAQLEISQGKEPSHRMLVPGVLPYRDYTKRRETWDKIRQCIGLDAQWYEGAEVLLFPPLWLNRAERIHESLRGQSRRAEAIGIDPAEGGDRTAMCAIDSKGVIELISKITPDTSVITSEALAFMRKHNVPPERVAIDRGGGGKQHADRLRAQGFNIRTVAFGETLVPDPRRGLIRIEEKKEAREEHYAYLNRRAEMYGELRLLLDPSLREQGFAIPAEYVILRSELAPIPLMYDAEGRLRLLPKNKRSPDSTEKTLVELIGHSPDEADALVLAVHALSHEAKRPVAGAIHSRR